MMKLSIGFIIACGLGALSGLVAIEWMKVGLGIWTLLDIGIVLYGLGAFIQIAEEWRQRGLTDTSFKSLFFLLAGPGLIAMHAYLNHHATGVIVAGSGALLALILICFKSRDRWGRRR